MKKVEIAVIGAGARGYLCYAPYAKQFPHEVKIVAVAEPNAQRREIFANEYEIPDEFVFSSWQEMMTLPKLCDAVLICTQDQEHYEPALEAINKGYHILLEKPMSPDPYECIHLAQMAEQRNLLLSICYVSRYTPFWSTLKQMIAQGDIGDIVSIQHNENVGYQHYSHSFVRGNWRNSDQSSPMILQKSCHDMDLIRWLVDAECEKISSFGSLSHFTEENAPEGSTDRCTNGCLVEHTCPFSATRYYLQDLVDNPFARLIADPPTMENRMKALEAGPYGKCVYRTDNNVVDHQVVNMEFANGATVMFSMSAFTRDINRIVQIMGTKGEIRGDFEKGEIDMFQFSTRKRTLVQVDAPAHHHGGGDEGIMRQFIADVRLGRTHGNLTSAEASVEGHIMAFAAEQSRLDQGKVIEMKAYYDHIIAQKKELELELEQVSTSVK